MSRPRALVATAPVAAAIVLTMLNDFVLKRGLPRWEPVTGKISDVAGLFFFPFLLVDLGRLALRGRACSQMQIFGAAALATATGFAALKLSTTARAGFVEMYRWGGMSAVVHPDLSDLWALLVLLPGFWWLRRAQRHESG